MTRRDILESVQEPFGDAFYYGPEFMSDRFRDDAAGREASGFSKKTYKDILDEIEENGKVRWFFPKSIPRMLPLPLHLHASDSPKWGCCVMGDPLS